MARYIDATDIAKQIADFKRLVNSPNSDYMTGYLCALSVTEGMIANTPTANVAPKAEVERKILVGIEAELAEALKSHYARRNEINAETELVLSANVSGKLAALRGIADFIAELKEECLNGSSEVRKDE